VRTLVVGDDEALSEIATCRTCGIDAHLGHREGLRIGSRIEDCTFCPLDEENVVICPHARRDHPHHVIDVVHVNVVIDPDNVFSR